MKETFIRFGPDERLFGMVTEAPSVRPLAVIVLNAGLVHRVGPFRMSVELARTLGSDGFPVLRFDQSGLGDSEPRRDLPTYEERAVADTVAALDAIQSRLGTDRFVLFGLCSGAMNAHRVAVADARVSAMVLVDGYAYPTAGQRVRHVAPRLLSVSTVAQQIGRRVPQLSGTLKGLLGRWSEPLQLPVSTTAERLLAHGDNGPASADRDGIFLQHWPPQAQIRSELLMLAKRGVRGLHVFTGGSDDLNYAEQFYENFPDPLIRRQCEVVFFREADHTFIRHIDRQQMFDAVRHFVRQEDREAPLPP